MLAGTLTAVLRVPFPRRRSGWANGFQSLKSPATDTAPGGSNGRFPSGLRARRGWPDWLSALQVSQLVKAQQGSVRWRWRLGAQVECEHLGGVDAGVERS